MMAYSRKNNSVSVVLNCLESFEVIGKSLLRQEIELTLDLMIFEIEKNSAMNETALNAEKIAIAKRCFKNIKKQIPSIKDNDVLALIKNRLEQGGNN